MTQPILENPTNHVVCVFSQRDDAIAAQESLVEAGLPESEIRVISNEHLAEFIDTSSKWFADTHVEIQRYQDELRNGATILSVPVTDAPHREQIHEILKSAGARLITHFGEWVTEMMK